MKFISTTGKGPEINFREAVIGNLPEDGGLYFPTRIPKLNKGFLKEVPGLELHEIAARALSEFCDRDIDKNSLEGITNRVFDFPIPLVEVENGIHCLELFHGPTYAFKDVGAKFLAECLAHFNTSDNQKTTVLVATSGDTGGAVANGFLGVDGVDVVILYPKGKVSELQEKQLTTLGQNIKALEVEGTFDDCQRLVKSAFADKEIAAEKRLSSANSINIARWLPQSVYYYVPLQNGMQDQVISIPSGNYGNLTSGVLAMNMGIPIRKFIAASNANDVVPRYLRTASYDPSETIATIANAMDVSDPSNFKRLLTLFGSDFKKIAESLFPFSLEDSEIKDTISKCFENNGYLLDPHSAIAFQGLKKLSNQGVFLGTAHYCKFLPTINESLSSDTDVPDFAKGLLKKEKKTIRMDNDFAFFKEFLLSQ